jgi:hypothetical protein
VAWASRWAAGTHLHACMVGNEDKIQWRGVDEVLVASHTPHVAGHDQPQGVRFGFEEEEALRDRQVQQDFLRVHRTRRGTTVDLVPVDATRCPQQVGQNLLR